MVSSTVIKAMLIASVNRVMTIIFVIIFVIVAASAAIVMHQHSFGVDQKAQSTMVQVLVQRGRDGLADSSQAARAYAATQSPGFLAAYHSEVTQGRQSERAVIDLHTLALTDTDESRLQAVHRAIEQVRINNDLVVQIVEGGDAATALAIAYGEAYIDTHHAAQMAFKRFENEILSRLERAASHAAHGERLALFTLCGGLACLIILMAWTLLVYCRRQVLDPLQALLQSLDTPPQGGSVTPRPSSAGNEIDQIMHKVATSQAAVAEMDTLRQIKTATAEIMMAVHQANSLNDVAQALTLHLSRRLNQAVVAVHFRPTPYAALQLFGNISLRNAKFGTANAVENDQPRASSAQPIDPALVTECAAQQRIIQIVGLPASYMRLFSGVGESHPRFLTLAPIVFDDETLGVIEIASCRPLQSQCLSLVTDVSASTAFLLDRIINNQSSPPLKIIEDSL
jgi:two-component system chemotaxis sensor kinase CheA